MKTVISDTGGSRTLRVSISSPVREEGSERDPGLKGSRFSSLENGMVQGQTEEVIREIGVWLHCANKFVD